MISIPHFILAANRATNRAPGPKTMPSNIHSKAKKHWPIFWRKYGKTCREWGNSRKTIAKQGKPPAGTWVLARLIFRRFCDKRNIPAFTGEVLDKDQKKTASKRIYNAFIKLNTKVKSLAKYLYSNDILYGAKVIKEIYKRTYYYRGSYFIETISHLKLNPKSDVDIRSILLKKGFILKNKAFVYTNGQAKISIIMAKDKLSILKEVNYKKQQILTILDTTEEDERKLKLLISKHIKQILKQKEAFTGKHFLKANVEGRQFPIIFSEDLSGKDQSNLDSLMNSLRTKELDYLFRTYNLDMLRNMGALFAYNLVIQLAKVFRGKNEKIPLLWQSILKKPKEYLDPAYIKYDEDIND